MNCHRSLLTAFVLLLCLSLAAQQNNRTVNEKCGAMQYLEKKLQQNAVLRARFEQKKIEFNRMVSSRSQNAAADQQTGLLIACTLRYCRKRPSSRQMTIMVSVP